VGTIQDTSSLDKLWGRLQDCLRAKLRREQFETWFTRAALSRIEEGRVVLAVQNGFTRDWLRNYYREVLEESVESVFGSALKVDFEVDPERTAPSAPDQDRSSGIPPTSAPAIPAAPFSVVRPHPAGSPHGGSPSHDRPAACGAAATDALRRGLLGEDGLLASSDVTLNPHYRFDNYVVGPCNRFAHAACVGVSENPGRIYNPLFLHGSVGLGKTHLLQSLCHSILERTPTARILYLSCETFVNHFIGALENGDLHKFRTKYRNVDLLVVDDIHILANKERTQEEFFHTFNTLYNAGKQIVLSSDSPPVDIPTLQNRLVSRFKWGLVTEIEKPCYETRMAILKRKSRERGRELPEDVACLLAEKIDTNIRELEGAVTKVLGYAGLSGQAVTKDLVRQCLRELFRARKGQSSIEDIMGVVTEHFGVKLSELQSKRRTNAIAYPRQIGMYLARRITRMSLEQIGGFFGGRDHSTVLYAVQKITRLTKEDPACAEMLVDLTAELQSDRSS
jgi:chromosomal replication initiator protein